MLSTRDEARRHIAALEAQLAEEREMRAALEAELAERAAAVDLAKEEARAARDGSATPLLDVGGDIMVVPVAGAIRGAGIEELAERLHQELSQLKSTHVIIDLGGAHTIDQAGGEGLVQLARSVELRGVRCVVSGQHPAVAKMLAEVGVHFFGLSTQRNLRHALEACRRTVGRSVSHPPPSMGAAATPTSQR